MKLDSNESSFLLLLSRWEGATDVLFHFRRQKKLKANNKEERYFTYRIFICKTDNRTNDSQHSNCMKRAYF